MRSESLLHFVETSVFRKRLDKLADLQTLFLIQADLLENPRLGNVIPGCDGARKGRVADRRGGRGKSASFRYIYLYLEKAEVIYLFMFYGKNEKDTLSGAEKKEVAALVGQLKEVYEEK